jgi:hypothetical protein
MHADDYNLNAVLKLAEPVIVLGTDGPDVDGIVIDCKRDSKLGLRYKVDVGSVKMARWYSRSELRPAWEGKL